MKHFSITYILLWAVFFTLSDRYQFAGQTTVPSQAVAIKQDRTDDVKKVADVLFNPQSSSAGAAANPYPLNSINQEAIDSFFGSRELTIDAATVQHIKIFYFYFEYAVKLEIAGKIAAYASAVNIDPIGLLEKSTWKELVQAVTDKSGGWQNLLIKLNAIKTPLLNIVQGSINAQRWQDIITTPFWQSIPVTPEILLKSAFWQNYLKYSVIKLFEQDEALLSSIFDVEKRIFLYIPNIEIAYYNSDFTYLRNADEFFRIHLALADRVRDRYIKDCADWQNLKNEFGELDLSAIKKESANFKETNFYKLVSLADQNFQSVVQKVEDKKITLDQQIQDPMLQVELTCLAMLKNIQAQLIHLFDYQQIEKTKTVLNNNAIKRPQPSILMYEAADYWHLHEVAMIQHQFEQVAPEESTGNTQKVVAGGQGDEKIIIQDFGSWLSNQWNTVKKEAKKVVQDIKQTGKDIAKLGLDAFSTVRDELKVGLTGAQSLGALLSGHPKDAEQLLSKAASLQQKVANELKQSLEDAKEILDDAVTVATDAASIGADLTSIAIAGITRDTAIADALDGALKSGAGILINMWAASTAQLFALKGALLYLTVDAIAIAADVVTKSIMDVVRGDYAQLGNDILNSVERMVSDVATTLWSTITFVGKYFLEQVMDAVKLVGYITSMLTEISVKSWSTIFKGFSNVFEAFGWHSAQQAMLSASQEIEAHRRLVSNTITTALLVGTVVLTDGAALPLIAMTVGPQVFQIGGGFQQDEQAKRDKAEQKLFLENYKTFVDNNKIIINQEKEMMVTEVHQKLSAQAANQERDLGFYQNYLRNYFGNMKEQMASYLGSSLAPQLLPDKTYKLRYADVGSMYGFSTGDGTKTGLFNLNPSQGFALYNQARDTFAQEIAVYPALVNTNKQEIVDNSVRKFWFNQKETFVVDNAVDEVYVKLQAIYVLNNFYIGIYFGGQEIDVASIIETQHASIDAAHLAKMLVYKKAEQNDPVSLNVYEHEGAGWLTKQVSGPIFEVGTWYHMKMRLQATSVSVKVWQDQEQEPSGWQSFSAQKTTQKTVGVISSGASVQYQFIQPHLAIHASSLRPVVSWQAEKDRALTSNKIMEQQLNPAIGALHLLGAVDKESVVKGQFIYTTRATNLKDAQGSNIDDYVILATRSGGRDAPTIINLGASPRMQITNDSMLQFNENACIVSLVTGNVYDKNGDKVTTSINVLDAYIKVNGALTDQLTAKIADLQKNYRATLLQAMPFGSINLTLTSEQELVRGQFIYQAISPIAVFTDGKGGALKDEQGNALYDYFVTVDKNGLVGAIFDQTITRMQSLVTGLVYEKSSAEPVDSGYETGSQALDDYAAKWGKRRPELDQLINKSVKKYNELAQAQTGGSKAFNTITPGKQADATSVAQETSKIPEKSAPIVQVTPASGSLQQRADEASAEQFSWGF